MWENNIASHSQIGPLVLSVRLSDEKPGLGVFHKDLWKAEELFFGLILKEYSQEKTCGSEVSWMDPS